MKEHKIEVDDLPEVYRVIAEECGVDTVIKIAKQFGGGMVYFPKYETLIIPARNRAIINDFDGYNTKYLSKKYKLAENTIREIIRESGIDDNENQYMLWDNGIS